MHVESQTFSARQTHSMLLISPTGTRLAPEARWGVRMLRSCTAGGTWSQMLMLNSNPLTKALSKLQC
jgi:hypothetical protein